MSQTLSKYLKVFAPGFIIIGLFLLLSYAGLRVFEPSAIEGKPFIEVLYMIILSATGEPSIEASSTGGILLLILILLFGIFIVVHLLEQVSGNVIEDRFRKLFKKSTYLPRAKSGHTILCGYNPLSERILEELSAMGRTVILVSDKISLEKAEVLRGQGIGYVLEDPVAKSTGDSGGSPLEKALIGSAYSVILALESESDNAFLCLTAKDLNPRVRVISHTSDYSSNTIKKFEKAGAEKIISSRVVGGHLLARAGVSPAATDFIQDIGDASYGIDVRELVVGEKSRYNGSRINHVKLKRESNCTVIGVFAGEKLLFNPLEETIINAGDTVIAIGLPEDFNKLEKILG